MQEAGSGLRELRPLSGRSPWRPLYRRVREDLFAIFAVAPEAERDEAGYNAAVKSAQKRRRAIERSLEKKAKASAKSKAKKESE